MKIAYTFVISDLFHYGHLQLLMAAAQTADKLICGVLTDEAVAKTGSPPISNFQERASVIESIKFVDEVMPQTTQDPFENLFKLKERFPADEIIFVYGEQWGEAPGGPSLNTINVTLKQQSFYKRLRNEHIACKIVEKYYPNLGALDTFTERFVIEGFEHFSKEKPKFSVTTKANTLQRLKPLLKKSHIEKTYVFTVLDWSHYKVEILHDIKDKFLNCNIVIRSSCLNEDMMMESKAGHYLSYLNINPQDESNVSLLIDNVIDSYNPNERNNSDQILIQQYTEDVLLSGVLLTRELGSNAPYYVINYDKTSQTDAVTSGKSASLIKIFKHTHRRLLETTWQKLLDSVDEIERIIPNLALDIEFAVRNDGEIVIFQVRPIAANHSAATIDEDKIESILNFEIKNYFSKVLEHQDILKTKQLIFSDMAFWNPAELIGCKPSPLSFDFFNILFMKKSWRLGLQPLGYKEVKSYQLMEKFCDKPYINVNLAFLSLIPNVIPDKYNEKLQSYYLNKLISHRYLHDKVEFEILFTAFDFNVSERMEELLNNDFTSQDISYLLDCLALFTRQIINQSKNFFTDILNKISALENLRIQEVDNLKSQNISIKLNTLSTLINTCEELGAVPFAQSARLAFIAESLLRSLVQKNIITKCFYNAIKNSFDTVAYNLTCAIANVANGKLSRSDFMKEYGHLRAGTYDITQTRYDLSDMQFSDNSVDKNPIVLDTKQVEILDKYLKESQLNIEFNDLYNFTKSAIELREYVKLVFTRTVSDCLENIAEVGFHYNLSRNDLSMLTIEEIVSIEKLKMSDIKNIISKRLSDFEIHKNINLPSLIFGQEDFSIIKGLNSKPNFVTQAQISGEVVFLDSKYIENDLSNKIVMIESADPGYHWIFNHKIKALITKFGGAASHMAICCAEMNIPAAIGCGEKFNTLIQLNKIRLDCANEIIESIN